jgi:hypothetical protein
MLRYEGREKKLRHEVSKVQRFKGSKVQRSQQ